MPFAVAGRGVAASRGLLLGTLLIVFLAGGLRAATVPAFVESMDGWLFVRGVVRYSVAEMRPHWPGYPVYILLGKLLAVATGDPVRALHWVSILASGLCAWPLMRLIGVALAPAERSSRLAPLLGGLLWALLPLPWLCGVEILSDGPALLPALASLLCSQLALREPSRRPGWLVSALVLGGLTIGMRLAYLPLLAPALYAAHRLRAERVGVGSRSVSLGGLALLALAATVAAWLAFQLAHGAQADAAQTRLAEHFGGWSRRVLAGGRWWQRPSLLAYTAAVYGFGFWWPGLSLVRLPLSGLLAWLLLAGSARLGGRSGDERNLLGLFVAPYLASVLLFQDGSLARYSLPLVAAGCIVAPLGLPRRGWARRLAFASSVACAAPVGLAVARLRSVEPPLGQQLAAYLGSPATAGPSLVLVTPDVAFVVPFLEELVPRVPCVMVETSELGAATRRAVARGLTVYATTPPRVNAEAWTPLARFRRPALLESRGPEELWIYRFAAPERAGAGADPQGPVTEDGS